MICVPCRHQAHNLCANVGKSGNTRCDCQHRVSEQALLEYHAAVLREAAPERVNGWTRGPDGITRRTEEKQLWP